MTPITQASDESCPVLPPGVKKIHWPLSDPAKAQGTEDEIMTVFRATRDEVRQRVETPLRQIVEGVDPGLS